MAFYLGVTTGGLCDLERCSKGVSSPPQQPSMSLGAHWSPRKAPEPTPPQGLSGLPSPVTRTHLCPTGLI